MHELSLCQSIFTIADRSREGRPVEVVHLRVGQLRQVVPETLEYCWRVFTDTTDLEGSVLEVEEVAAAFHCHDCSADTEAADRFALGCAACGSGRVDVVRGEELMVAALDLADLVPRGAG